MFQAKITTKEGAAPVWTPSRKTPYKLEKVMDEKMETLIKSGVVEPLQTHSDWNSPVFLVEKGSPVKRSSDKSGTTEQRRPANSYRIVADLRNLNKACLSDNFELPNLNHVLDTIGSDKYFSVFDLSSSFHQIRYRGLEKVHCLRLQEQAILLCKNDNGVQRKQLLLFKDDV
jgi:hypothetical protein